MLSLDLLPADILLLIVPFLTLRDVVSLSMVNKAFDSLSREHSYWLKPLRTTRILRPIACTTMDDLSARTTIDLKQIALHTVRLTRNWSQPSPQPTRAARTFSCEQHNSILYIAPGTFAIVLYSKEEGTVICADVETGVSSAPVHLGQIFDMSSPLEEPTGFSVGALVEFEGRTSVVVLRATVHPVVATNILFSRYLDQGYMYTGIFMTSSVVGVARVQREGAIEVQSFNLVDPDVSTTIITDRPGSPGPVLGSTVIGDSVYLIMLQFREAFVYLCPPRLLANSEHSPEFDYTIQRNHVARIPPASDSPDHPLPLVPNPRPLLHTDYCVLSTEPNHGCNTISVARKIVPGLNGIQLPHSLEITFWPRPSSDPIDSKVASKEREKAEARRMQPSQTVSIPGSLSSRPGMAWELLVIANSGLGIVLVVDPPPKYDDELNDGEEEDRELNSTPPPPPAPKLLLVRYDPVMNSVSVHDMQMPQSTIGPSSETLDTRTICGLALDDHRGYIIVCTLDRTIHYIPFA